MATFLLVRHGEIEGEEDLRYYGFTDIGLSLNGLRQAELTSRRLSSITMEAAYASDLRRAMDTAYIITSNHRIEVIPCKELREVNLGKLEGLTFKEITRKYPQIARQWLSHSPNISFPEGERLTDLSLRITTFVEEIQQRHTGETILIIAHDGSLRMVLCALLNLGLKGWWGIKLNKASLSIVEVGNGEAVLSLLNDRSHLDG